MYFDDNNNEQTTKIDLTKINELEIDFSNFTEGTNEFHLELPFSKKQITAKLMTSKIQKDIDRYMKSISKINSQVQTEITSRYKFIILSVEGNTEKSHINNFIDNEMLAVDSLALRKHLNDNTPDLDMRITVTQPNGDEKEVAVLLTAQFLWPTL